MLWLYYKILYVRLYVRRRYIYRDRESDKEKEIERKWTWQSSDLVGYLSTNLTYSFELGVFYWIDIDYF